MKEDWAEQRYNTGPLVIAQTANILFYLGRRHGLAARDEAGRLWAHQLQLTIANIVDGTSSTIMLGEDANYRNHESVFPYQQFPLV